MKKLILFIIIPLISLTGCKIVSPEETGQTLEQKEFFFQKNQECNKQRKDIDLRVAQMADKYDRYYQDRYIEEIFFSPKTNSCLFVEYSSTDLDDGYLFSRKLFDIWKYAGNVKSLEGCSGRFDVMDIANDANLSSCENFDKKIQTEYKNY